MKNILTSFLLFLLLAGVVFANRIIAKDSTPGGIYIVGPDVSPDSTDLTLLYYSPDAGSTLVIRDTLDWTLFPVFGIAADVTEGIVYLSRTSPANDGLWVSFDGGINWENRGDYHSGIPYSGNIAGEILMGIAMFSTDYGVSAFAGAGQGLPIPLNILFAGGGTEQGESYFINTGGWLYRGWEYADTFILMNRVTMFVTVGNLPGELWGIQGISNDSIFWSASHGSTFTFLLPVPMSLYIDYLEPDQWDFIRGYISGSLFICRADYDTWFRGGFIKICYTENFGDTFVCVTHDASGVRFDTILKVNEIKAEPRDYSINAYPNPFNSTIIITVNKPTIIEIFDISGKCVHESSEKNNYFEWTPNNLPGGIYLIKVVDSCEMKKIIYLR